MRPSFNLVVSNSVWSKNIYPAPENTPFLSPARLQEHPAHVVLRRQGQHLTGFYWFIFLLCSTDCCDTKANFRNMSPASSEAVLLWNIRMAKANICIRRAEGTVPGHISHRSRPFIGSEEKKQQQPAPSPTSCSRQELEHMPVWKGGGAASQEASHKASQSSPQSAEWLKHSIVLDVNEPSLWRAVGADPPCPPISYVINQITPRSREGK